MQRIIQDIKSGQFHKVYLLYGTQDYLRKQYRDKLVDALTGGEKGMNYTYLEGQTASVPELIDLAETLPFFATRRVVVVENTEWFKRSDEALAAYLKEVCETTVLVCVEQEIDKRTSTYKAADKAGLCVAFDEVKEEDLMRWLVGKVKKEGKTITGSALQLFVDMTGPDMENMQKEMEKLLCFCMEKTNIDEGDVEGICTRRISDQVFQMLNAMAEKKKRQTMELYYDLVALKVAPLKILTLIVRQFNLLYQVKVLKTKGYSENMIAQELQMKSWQVRKYLQQSGRFSIEYLRDALECCIQTDEDVKTGRISDHLGIELLLVQFSS